MTRSPDRAFTPGPNRDTVGEAIEAEYAERARKSQRPKRPAREEPMPDALTPLTADQKTEWRRLLSEAGQ